VPLRTGVENPQHRFKDTTRVARKKSGLLVRIAVDIAAGLPHSPSL